MEIVAEEDDFPSSPPLTVAVAVNGKRNSKFALKWALERFIPEGRVLFKLLYVKPKVTAVPTPMGNSIPISKVRDEVASAYKKEMEWQTNAMLVPYKHMCTRRQVEADAVVIEAEDVAAAISGEITKFSITTLVVGASSRNVFTRIQHRDITSRISASIPTFCTAYVVSKGRLSSIRPSSTDINENNRFQRCNSSISSITAASYTSTTTEGTEKSSASSSNYSYIRASSLPMQRYQALLTLNQAIVNKKTIPFGVHHSRRLSVTTEEELSSFNSSSSELQESSFRSSATDTQPSKSDQASTSDNRTDSSNLGSQVDLNFELEKLRTELRHVRGMYAMAQKETTEASQHLIELRRRRIEETSRLRDISLQEQELLELAEHEKEKTEAAKREAEFVRECIEREVLQRKEAENKAARDSEEKQKLEKSFAFTSQKYKNFTWGEIVSATLSFSDALKIGMGAYGMVYKCNLNNTTAAVKVLHSAEEPKTKQFQQELEILSSIRHPHLLLLLGACTDHGCLVYEYMEKGSLEDRLLRKNNTPPIPWFDRYRIAWEVASALAFLHNTRPKPIVHRDLKPSNILLNHNFVSKIGDVGLSTILPATNSAMSIMYKDTAPVGTFCYIDPEYQRSGMVSPKSDLYAFGIVVLQLLTAKPPIALAHIVETALEEGNLPCILDSEAGAWPLEETQELAVLGLSCAELRQNDRPDLETQVLPMLARLKEIGERARDLGRAVESVPPSHFICPILKDVMNDPCVAADGYTYDHNAIELWFSINDKSPMTNAPLPHKHLIPNYTVHSAIMEWKSKIQ